MRTYDLSEAAALLKMSPEALRQRAKGGSIPAYKPGKRWVFLETDLHAYLIGYAENGQALRATPTRGGKSCRSTNEGIPGGSASRHPTANEYTNLLKLPTGRQPRNTTTR
ncbi:MAG: helix-turn-helix domain-containing protein [Candidatus Contendobacter sp.]|nr:MAG: helix-turn-helix domain-containing protein [Candidatus Contendobacter sp.]